MKNAKGARGLSINARSIPEEEKGRNSCTGYDADGMSCPPQAVQPIRVGTAPTTEPTHVFATLLRFIQVYTPAYRAIFDKPKKAVVGLTIVNKMAGPAMPVAVANAAACRGVIALLTRGLFRVRVIWASSGTSCN